MNYRFMIGCNYWASNAGADMWKCYDGDCVREDLSVLASQGVEYIRVFPKWRDFQPVMPLYAGRGVLAEYCLEGEREATNPYYLDEGMLDKFAVLLDICDEYNIRVIVGLVTGWMSGRLYVPSAINGKNVLTDTEALYFEQLFIKGFVRRFKERKTVYAWDLGNECNCMGEANRIEALHWTATIANAIRAEDNSRPIVSGMHGLELESQCPWQITDQGEWTDILTTHPYPYWCAHTRNDKILSLRTLMHATAQNKLYTECSGKPCMAEEIGTMGPMLASDEAAASFMRVNLFSLWANGSVGALWWCGHDQHMLDAFPYSTNMVELELGLLRGDRSPKPVAQEIKKFGKMLHGAALKLPEAEYDAVCLLSSGQRQWGVCYTTYVLARQAGMNVRFAYADNGIPEANTYLLPSINGITVMHKARYEELKARVRAGARLYISMNNGVLSGFEDLTGLKVVDSHESAEKRSFEVGGECYSINSVRQYELESVGAEVIACDSIGRPMLARNVYGKGEVIYLNIPLEESLIDGHNAFDGSYYKLYDYIFKGIIDNKPIKINGEGVYSTLHFDGDKAYAVAINYTDKEQAITIIANGYSLSRVIYGSDKSVKAYDAVVLEFEKA